MKNLSCIPFLFVTLFSFSVLAQTTMSIEDRNELIRNRWNRSLVDDISFSYNKEANNLLVQTTSSIEPGKALCVAMGQGRNALYLARNGWDVTGFDLADRAVAQAVSKANEENLKLTTEIASFDSFNYGENQWDLITWLYGGCLQVDDITKKIKKALKTGGLFVFEFFHRDAGIAMGRPKFGCETHSIKEMFVKEGGFQVVLYEEKEGRADFGMDDQKLIYMVLTKK